MSIYGDPKSGEEPKISNSKWKLLRQLIEERHKIVHNGESATLEPEKVVEILKSIDSLSHNIQQKLLRHAASELQKKFTIIKQGLDSRKNNLDS